MRQLWEDRACESPLGGLRAIREACRAVLNETLRATLTWVIRQVRDFENDPNPVLAKLRLA